MPQVDVQWPSEDEDFDAKTDVNSSKKATTKVTAIQPKVEEEPAEVDTVDDSNISEESPVSEEPAEASEVDMTNDDDVREPEPEAWPETASQSQESAKDVMTHDSPTAPVATTAAVAKSKRDFKPMLRLGVEVLLVIAVFGLGLYAWSLAASNNDLKSQNEKLNNDPQALVDKQNNDLLNKIGALMQLPSNETPTIANVNNAAQAKQQSAFFANAQNGDKVLMYVKTGEAILYRPSTNKIILVAPLTFNNNATSSTSSTTTPKTTTPSTTSPSTTNTTTTKKP